MPIAHLTSRSLIEVYGEDAAVFLQNILSNDISAITPAGGAQYNLLLSPQGQILHDLFVLMPPAEKAAGAGTGVPVYWLDVFAPRRDDLLRRLAMFKLRARVNIRSMDDAPVLAFWGEDAAEEIKGDSFIDPRHPGLGVRLYADSRHQATAAETAYTDMLVEVAILPSQGLVFGRDFVHDVGFHRLNAIGWNKGCFIGQEVTARVEYRGLAKRAVYLIETNAAAPLQKEGGFPSIQIQGEGGDAGELRLAHSRKPLALALLKKQVVEGGASLTLAENGGEIRVASA